MTETPGTALGVDVGGTAIKFGLVRADGTLQHTRQVPTAKDSRVLADIVATELERTPADRLGLVTPGIVDDRAGVVRFSANMGWRDEPVRDIVQQRIGREIGFGDRKSVV